jgi:soluble lytic murein transglycosylase-like protein
MGPRHLLRALIAAAAVTASAGCGADAGPPGTAATPSPTSSAAPAPTATPTAGTTPVPPPAADAPLPAGAGAIAAELAAVRPRLRAAAAAWDGRGTVPAELELLALREQRLTLRLSERRRLIAPALAALPGAERRAVRDDVRALRALARLSASWPVKRDHRTGPAEPPARLERFYRAAHRRFGVPVPVLAAVNYVESSFGKLRNDSVAGAQGPMQFIPATWAAYGLGGDIQDPRDAILGAANYLHANGSPADDARALLRYNPSPLYVEAVQRYARRMRTAAQVRAFWARAVFVRARGGTHRRLTGPGLDG